MRDEHLESALILMLGGLLGLEVASWRNFQTGQAGVAQAQGIDKGKPGGGGIFSPPGTFEGGTVVPAPNEPPFKGNIGRTISESTSDWPPLAVAPKGSPDVLFTLLADVWFAALGRYGSPASNAAH